MDHTHTPLHRVLALAALVTAALVSCGGDDGAAPSPEAPTADEPSPEATSAESASPASTDEPPDTISLSYGLVNRSLSTANLTIAEEMGFFEEEGLDMELIVVGQSSTVCQQVIAGALDVGACSLNDAIQAVEAGGNVTIAWFENTIAQPSKILATPDTTSWEDLQGTNLMIGGPRDNTYYMTKILMEDVGMSIDDDVILQFAGSSVDRWAALSSGAVEATILSVPMDFMAEQAGYVVLDDVAAHLPSDEYFGGGPVVERSWAAENQEALERMFRAMEKAAAFFYDPANRETVIELMIEATESDPAVAEYAYDRLNEVRYYSDDGLPNDAGIQGTLDSLVLLEFIPDDPDRQPSDFYDLSFVGLD